jgi:hypothetical protein
MLRFTSVNPARFLARNAPSNGRALRTRIAEPTFLLESAPNPACLAQVATEREADMRREVVLLKAVEGTREGWLVMERDEFLEQMDLEAWNTEQVLIGIVVPAGPPRKLN